MMLFRLLLKALGLLLRLGARFSQRFRNQITRSRVIEIRCRAGAAQHYVFDQRRVESRSGSADHADATVIFESPWHGIRTLLSTKLVTRMVNDVLDGRIKVEGNIMLLLWFQGLAQMVFPITKPPQLSHTPPDAYITHRASESVSKRIPREPATDTLDPTWTSARRAHNELVMIEVNQGRREPPLF